MKKYTIQLATHGPHKLRSVIKIYFSWNYALNVHSEVARCLVVLLNCCRSPPRADIQIKPNCCTLCFV